MIKSIAVNILTGASVVTALLTVLVGYSDRINPADHPTIGCVGMVFPFFLVVNAAFLFAWVLIRWRRAWIPLAAFLAAYSPMRTYIPLHSKSDIPDGCIKVLSYNVAGYGGNYKYDNGLDTIMGYLRRQDADIVCLQEDMSAKFNPVERMPELYPYNDTVHITPPDVPTINAVGIHSRFPILRHERISYESRSNGSVAFFLQVGNDTVIVINNHLESTHLSTDDRNRYKDMLSGNMNRNEAQAETRHLLDKLGDAMSRRAVQADAVHNYVNKHLSHYPIIVCGDFNDTPISYTRHTIAKGLTDCYVETGMGPGISFNTRGFSFRIDHIMCSTHFTPYNCTVDSHIDVSDHYPVYCWLSTERFVK